MKAGVALTAPAAHSTTLYICMVPQAAALPTRDEGVHVVMRRGRYSHVKCRDLHPVGTFN